MTAELSYSLEALQRRWQSEKTPQVGLRLAEEYRRRGDLEASIEALSAGLEVYPTHTSSRVALSRYLVDGERFEEAVPHLEQIVALDPTHLVANKLLVGAYAGIGRLEDARDKLDIYEMMAEGDTDIERLHELLSAERQKRSASPAAVADVTDVTDVTDVVDVGPVTAVDGEISSVGSVAAAIAADEPAAMDFEPVAAGLVPQADSAEFEAGATPADSASPVVTAASEAPEPPAARFALGDPFAQVASEEPFGSALVADPSPDYWQEVADEGIFAFDPLADVSTKPVKPAAVEEVEEVEEEPVAPAASTSEPAVDSTVTLGRLYLEQGHREQAVDVFKDVLTREPDNEAARRELESFVPEAATVGDSDVEEVSAGAASGVLERKRSALTAYLAQIRRAVAAGI